MTLPPKYPLQTLMATEAKHVAELNKILTMSMNRLDKEIAAMGKAGTNPLTIMQAKATRAAMASFLEETFDDVEGMLKLGIKNAAAAASGVVSAYEAQLLGLVMSPDAVANLAKSEAQRAAQGIEAAMQRVKGSSYVPLSEQVYNTKQLALNWVDKRITQGLASGWSASKLAGELKGMINPAVSGGVSYAAMRTARTEINNAFHASSQERYLNSPVVLEVDWHLSSSHPEGDICDTLAEESPYPKKSVPQKPHPQCYCYITPSLPEPAKFIDNLFKGKYGNPPEAEAVEALIKAPAKAGTKAAGNLANNAMHGAMKTDKKPTKKMLGNQMGLDEVAYKNIKSVQAFQKFVNQLDDAGKAYWDNAAFSTKKVLIQANDEEIDSIIKWFNGQVKPVTDKWEDLPMFGTYTKGDYDDLLEFMFDDDINVLMANNINPQYVLNMVKQMDIQQINKFQQIIGNADFIPVQGPKMLFQTLQLDLKSNSLTGDLTNLAVGKPPAKVWTKANIADEFDIDIAVVNNMEALGLTPEQMAAQMAKLSPSDIADIKKLEGYQQGHYFSKATTPPPEAFPKPVSTPDIGDLKAKIQTIDDKIAALGNKKNLTEGDFADSIYLKEQKTKLQKQLDEANDKLKGTTTPKTSFTELEDEYSVPVHYWQESGLTADELKAAINWIDEGNDTIHNMYKMALDNAFDEYDGDLIVDTIKKAHAAKLKAGKPTIVDPPTIPKPPAPSPVPPPTEIYDSYEDLAEIYVKGDFKPNLLAKTGASPQQISSYIEDMSQAQYDHFMSLKWPSQKKHFEKLATKTDNASTYQAKVEFAEQISIDANKIKPPLSSDPEVLAKWQGKNQPPKPLEPKPPTTPGKAAYDDFLEKSKQKFADFAKATGNPKNDLTKSNNWSKFQQVVNNQDMAALKQLQFDKYIDQDLYDLAVAAGKKATTPDPGDALKYKKAMEEYAEKKAKFDADLVQWREANGITSSAKGTFEGALVHADNGAGVRWANTNLPVAQGEARAAVKKYSGSSYREWNNALRANKDGDSLPPGQWAESTRKADKAMVGLPEDVVVRRGTGWDEFEMGGQRNRALPPPPPHELIGSVQTNHGYISTSVGNSAAFTGQVSLRIRVPQGHGAAWVDPYSNYQGERELLLGRSTSMFIHDVYQEGGRWYVDAEVIPRGEDASGWVPIKSVKRG